MWGLQRRDRRPPETECAIQRYPAPDNPGRPLGVMGTWALTSQPAGVGAHVLPGSIGAGSNWRAEAASGGLSALLTPPPSFHKPRPGSRTPPSPQP